MTEGALDDVRVLDLTHYIVGPYCTKLLADYGADVIKAERPGSGDGCRRLGPFKDDDPHAEKSGLFCYLNTNKRGLTLNLASDTGRDIFFQLLEGVHLVVENFKPGTMERFGLSFDELEKRQPGVSLLSISNFGSNGPYRDWSGSDLVLFAMGGEMFSMGLPEREPIKMAGTAALIQSGAVAAVAALAAAFASRIHGFGQHVEVSIFETHAGGVDRRHAAIMAYQFSGRVAERVPGWGVGYPGGVYPCADGYIEISAGAPHWDRVVRMLGSPEPLLDPKWREPTAQSDPELKAEFEALFYPWLLERTKKEAWEAAQAEHVLCAPLYTMEDFFQDEHFRSRGFFAQLEREFVGGLTYPGPPFRMSMTPWALRLPAPTLGQHNAEILGALGYSREDLVILRERGVV